MMINMRALLVLGVMAAGLDGCMTVPHSAGELVKTSSVTQTFCYPDAAGVVEQRMYNFLASCYGGHPAPGAATAMTDAAVAGAAASAAAGGSQAIGLGTAAGAGAGHTGVEVTDIPGGKRMAVSNFVGYGYAADVTAGQDKCATQVHMYAVTGMWRKFFGQVDHAARGGSARCPM